MSEEPREKAIRSSATAPHEAPPHRSGEAHHHHTHAANSRHPGHHHLLQVEGLSAAFEMYAPGAPFFEAERRLVPVIHDVSLGVHEGEVLAVVGASGAGKSLLAEAIMGIAAPNERIVGRIWFDGELEDEAGIERLRSREIAFVPQSIACLDPLMRVGEQVRGIPRGKGAARKADVARRIERQRELFRRYRLDESVERLYPHELSGGMARRVLLCCALVDEPRLIIADEPTPGLDLQLAEAALADLRAFADEGGAVMLITHDIELALAVADRVAVFHDGTVVEETSVASFASPELLRHPFSRELWHALPEHDFAVASRSVR